MDYFHGSEVVLVPPITNDGSQPWRDGVPEWLSSWVVRAQAESVACRWSLCGLSRGAAWGLTLAADEKLHFHRVLLVAPYVLPSCSERFVGMVLQRCLLYGNNLCIVFGSREEWQPCDVIRTIQRSCLSCTLDGLRHLPSLRQGPQRLWSGLVSGL